MNDIIFWLINSIAIFIIGFYYGFLYGHGVFRTFRYWRLRVIRWKQGRHKYNDKIILGK